MAQALIYAQIQEALLPYFANFSAFSSKPLA
jgi:hypothetical protein